MIHCPDKPGILAVVTEFINQHKGNILYLDQYVNREEGVFFMRVEWDLTDFRIPKDKIEEYFTTLIAVRYEMSFRFYYSDKKPRMAIFVSKMSHCLYDLLARYAAGEWNVEIPLIISNHPDMEPVAKRFGIEYHYFPITKETKTAQEAKELELLTKYKVTFCVLARYMQVLSSDFIEHYPNRIINIHHSFLPAFVGADPYQQAYDKGVKLIGATAHYVTAELDQGPIIEQDVHRVTHRQGVIELRAIGRDIERNVLARAVNWHVQNRVIVTGNKTVVFN